MNLTRYKCVKILKYYKKSTRGISLPTLRRRTTEILREKMCRCVNALYKKNGGPDAPDAPDADNDSAAAYSRAVAICKNSVYTKKRISPAPKFSCKKRLALVKDS
jgi:hypothetical protein